MNIYSKTIFTSTILLAFGFFPLTNTFAHPGNTASDGCHYCRTNCDYWGVTWNARHCHSGGNIDEDAEMEALIEEYENSPSYYEDRYGNIDNGYDYDYEYSINSTLDNAEVNDSNASDSGGSDNTWLWILGIFGVLGLFGYFADN